MPRACAPGRRDGKAPPHSAIFLRIYARTVSCHPPAAACRKVSAYAPPRTCGVSTAAQRQRVSGFCPSPRAYAPGRRDGKAPPHSAIFLRIYARTVSCHPPAASCRKVSAYALPRTRGVSTAAQRLRASGFCPSPRAYAPCEKGKTPPAPAPLHLSFTGQSLSSVRPRI